MDPELTSERILEIQALRAWEDDRFVGATDFVGVIEV